MNDSIESNWQEAEHGSSRRWLLFIHQLPPKPDYLRVKLRRRLRRLGAIALKNSVYTLPETPDTREDFEWLLREVVADGGEATICSARMLAGTGDGELESASRAEREAEYTEIEREAVSSGASERLRRRLEAVMGKDFFGAAGRAAAERAVAGATAPATGRPTGAVWVTRAGVYVDRIASAWLIRRFLDPAARFRFVGPGDAVGPSEIRFDMFGGEFTHEGDRCTFETLVRRFELADAALVAIGEIVHDIDLKEERYGRRETAGIESVVKGIGLGTDDDRERLERGIPVFDGLYARLRSDNPIPSPASAGPATPSPG